jgi:DNA repair protein RadC
MLVSLDDRALLALMLARGRSGAEPDRMAAGLFDRFGGLAAILSADLPELARIEGIGPNALLKLKLLRLLCERLTRCEAEQRPIISTSSALLAYLRIALAEASGRVWLDRSQGRAAR